MINFSKKQFILMLLLINCLSIKKSAAQINLLPDSSFENCEGDFNLILTSKGSCIVLKNWYNVYGWPEVNGTYTSSISSLTSFGFSNSVGYQLPQSGGNYLAMFFYDGRYAGNGYPDPCGGDCRNKPEYIGTELIEPLRANKHYKVSAYISLTNNSYYAINRIGFYFTEQKIIGNDIGGFINATPQVEAPNKIYKDTLNWEKIEGEFIAQGGEKHLTMGNFHLINDTDTLKINDLGMNIYSLCSLYYIDDVSVICLDCTVGINEQEQSKNVFYNNSTNTLSVSKQGSLVIYNMQGVKVKELLVVSQQVVSLRVEDLGGAGIYIWQLQTEKEVQRGKFVISE